MFAGLAMAATFYQPAFAAITRWFVSGPSLGRAGMTEDGQRRQAVAGGRVGERRSGTWGRAREYPFTAKPSPVCPRNSVTSSSNSGSIMV